MQYQVFNKQTEEVVAWIDTDSDKVVLHKDYDIKSGNTLSALEEFNVEALLKTTKEYELSIYIRIGIGRTSR